MRGDDVRPGSPPWRPGLEVGPDPVLAGAIVEGVLGGAAAGVKAAPSPRFRFNYHVVLTDGRSATVRLAPPRERDRLVAAASWLERLRGLGLRLPEIIARDLESEFPYLVLRHEAGSPVAGLLNGASLSEIGGLAGRLADIQDIVAAIPAAELDAAQAEAGITWSSFLTQRLAGYEATVSAAGLFAPHHGERILARIDAAREMLDAIKIEPFIPGPFLAGAYVGTDGDLGFEDISPPILGDRHLAPARLLADLLAGDHPPVLADAWLALSGGRPGPLYHLYAALSCFGLMASYGTARGGPRRLSLNARQRLEALLNQFLGA